MFEECCTGYADPLSGGRVAIIYGSCLVGIGLIDPSLIVSRRDFSIVPSVV